MLEIARGKTHPEGERKELAIPRCLAAGLLLEKVGNYEMNY